MRLINQRQKTDTPDRPSHFNEDVNEVVERRDETAQDFATTEADTDAATGFPPVAEPVPVILTEAPPRARVIRRASVDTYTLTAAVDRLQSIAGNDLTRTRLYVRNLDDTNPAFLALSGLDKNQSRAFKIEPNTDVEMFHNAAVWAFNATSTVDISVLQEYEVENL